MTELWQVGIIRRPLEAVMCAGLDGAEIVWLPEPGSFRFNADPFGLGHDNGFTVMVEAYDYRTKRGEIHYYNYDHDWRPAGQGIALQRPFHLSYPVLIRHGGDIYMLPEAHRSGRLTLYRAVDFPVSWAPVADLLDVPAIDASIIEYNGRWWMFYSLPGTENRAMRELHVAHAPSLMGPWTPHAHNPVRSGLDASRPGGKPVVVDDRLHLPMQDCTGGYGAGLSLLRVETLTPDSFAATVIRHLAPRGLHPRFADGLHTLSGDGDVTLIDVKRLDDAPGRAWVDWQRRLGRFFDRR